MTEAGSRAVVQRVVALMLLVPAGIVSLPVAATFLDGESTENLILPAQVVGMAVLGAVIGSLLPGVAGVGSTRARGARWGALVGVIAALVGLALFFLLLNGFSGA